jgi:hypothetical protein
MPRTAVGARSDSKRRSYKEICYLRLKLGPVPVDVLLELCHVLEDLGKAASAFPPGGSQEAAPGGPEHRLGLRHGRVSRLAAGLRQSATQLKLRGQNRQAGDPAAHSFLMHKAVMRSDESLTRGLPLGRGAADGACRTLLKDRLERPGRRGTVDGAEAVSQLRATALSGDGEE